MGSRGFFIYLSYLSYLSFKRERVVEKAFSTREQTRPT